MFHPNLGSQWFNGYYYIHLLRPKQEQASVAQLVEALHRNRRATRSIPARGPIVECIKIRVHKIYT